LSSYSGGSVPPKKTETAFAEVLKKKGLKVTLERQKIYEEIAAMKKHFDADELFERFKSKGLPISRDTVYRNLPLLLEAGMLQKSAGGSKREYFENLEAKGHHDHMICVRCGAIVEFRSEAFEALQQKLCEKFQCNLIYHDHRLFVECSRCSGSKKKYARRTSHGSHETQRT
jgi:Fur family ferric uptake transcriptional regulator